MKYFSCTVYVSVPPDDSQHWSEHTDETFHLAGAVADSGGPGPVHLVDYREIKESTFIRNRYKTLTAEGGV